MRLKENENKGKKKRKENFKSWISLRVGYSWEEQGREVNQLGDDWNMCYIYTPPLLLNTCVCLPPKILLCKKKREKKEKEK